MIIPSSPEWLATISGALSELIYPSSWEYSGGVSVDDAVTVAQAMLASFYADDCGSDCADCPSTGEIGFGAFTLRLGIGGAVEQWDGESWEEPTGDYAQPTVPERSEPTEFEQRCAAAVNAANVYEQLYELITDAAATLSFLDEFLEAVFSGITAAVGSWAGETAEAFTQLGAQFASQFFFVWKSVTDDYWNTDFNEFFICSLLENSTVTGDVVSFDYDAIRSDIFDYGIAELDLNRFLLVQQLDYLFYYCAGVDGLNAAGATTEISDSDCEECSDTPTWFFYPEGGWTNGKRGYCEDEDWRSSNRAAGVNPGSSEILMAFSVSSTVTITRIEVEFSKSMGSMTASFPPNDNIIVNSGNGWYNGTAIKSDLSSTNTSSPWIWTGSQSVSSNLTIWMFAAAFDSSGSFGEVEIERVYMEGSFGSWVWSVCD